MLAVLADLKALWSVLLVFGGLVVYVLADRTFQVDEVVL
jgi:hypothetical protein